MLGLLMVNALAAADHLVVPTQAEPLAMHGLAGMQRTAQMVARSRQRPLPVGAAHAVRPPRGEAKPCARCTTHGPARYGTTRSRWTPA
jgi:hypothetical protein